MISIIIGVSLIVLTSTVLATCFIFAYKQGYEKGKLEVVKGAKVTIKDKKTIKYLKDYAKVMNYTGE